MLSVQLQHLFIGIPREVPNQATPIQESPMRILSRPPDGSICSAVRPKNTSLLCFPVCFSDGVGTDLGSLEPKIRCTFMYTKEAWGKS